MSEPSATPPVPPVPPVPRYGEYAPSGYVAPPQPPTDPYAAPQLAQPYGQPYGAASYPPQPGARPRKVWDLVLTSILLVVGLFGMLIGVSYGVVFADPELIDEAFQQQGLGGFNGEVGAASTVLILSHVILYLLAVGGAIPLLITKHVAFWVPLAAGVIAAIIFWVTVIAVVASDPGLMQQAV